MKKPKAIHVALMVEARQGRGRLEKVGAAGKAAWDLWRAGYLEDVGDWYELNLRGQDIADEAIALARQAHVRP